MLMDVNGCESMDNGWKMDLRCNMVVTRIVFMMIFWLNYFLICPSDNDVELLRLLFWLTWNKFT